VIATTGTPLHQVFLRSIERNIHFIEPRYEPDRIEFLSSVEFAARQERHEWLIEGMLVANQPAVIGGAAKDGKTALAVDLVLSIGSAKPFLGAFPVQARRRAGIVSVESGIAALKDRALRICQSKNACLSDADVQWCTRFPRLDSESRVSLLAKQIRSSQLQVLVFDPLYLMLPVRKGGVAPGDLFAMGDLLARLADVCLSSGCTPIFCHHFNRSSSYRHRKPSTKGHWEPPGLFDLSQAGAAEFFRQWMLLGRRAPFDLETGRSELWLSVGGSAGFSGLWAVDIEEGRLNSTSGERRWKVGVRTRAQLVEGEKEQKKVSKAKNQLDEDCLEIRKKLFAAKHGETKRGIREGTKLSPNSLKAALAELQIRKWIEAAIVLKQAGTAGERGYPGYRLTELGEHVKDKVPTPTLSASRDARTATDDTKSSVDPPKTNG
jgi:AAA domain